MWEQEESRSGKVSMILLPTYLSFDAYETLVITGVVNDPFTFPGNKIWITAISVSFGEDTEYAVI